MTELINYVGDFQVMFEQNSTNFIQSNMSLHLKNETKRKLFSIN